MRDLLVLKRHQSSRATRRPTSLCLPMIPPGETVRVLRRVQRSVTRQRGHCFPLSSPMPSLRRRGRDPVDAAAASRWHRQCRRGSPWLQLNPPEAAARSHQRHCRHGTAERCRQCSTSRRPREAGASPTRQTPTSGRGRRRRGFPAGPPGPLMLLPSLLGRRRRPRMRLLPPEALAA